MGRGVEEHGKCAVIPTILHGGIGFAGGALIGQRRKAVRIFVHLIEDIVAFQFA